MADMTRRRFLGELAAAATGLAVGVLVPGRLLRAAGRRAVCCRHATVTWGSDRALVGDVVPVVGVLWPPEAEGDLVVRVRGTGRDEARAVLAEVPVSPDPATGPGAVVALVTVPRPAPTGPLRPGLHPLEATLEDRLTERVLGRSPTPLEVLVQPAWFGL